MPLPCQAPPCCQQPWRSLTRAHCFQIDPSVLQQSNLLAQQLTGEPAAAPPSSGSVQTPDSTVPASVVLQPISGLSLQPTVTAANLTIGPLSEQDCVLTTSNSGKNPPCQVLVLRSWLPRAGAVGPPAPPCKLPAGVWSPHPLGLLSAARSEH